ncbi:MAG: DUF624 domain-containing protein [Lachnospiraceae bacterium]|nr:DUF624 domain-containing protein [Lachnospiraceae bacterium]
MGFVGRIFNNDSAFGRLMTRIAVLTVCNLMFVLCTVPVFTIGAGWSAMCHTFLKMSKIKDTVNPFREFPAAFKANFKRATVSFLFFLFIFAFLALEWYWCGQFGGFFLTLRLGLLMIAVCLFVIALYIFPVMTVFPGKLTGLVKHCIYFAFKKPLYLLVILSITILPFILTYAFPDYYPLAAFIWFFFGFALVARVTAVLLYREFEPFIENEL